MDRLTCGRFPARYYRSTGPEEVWTDTSQNSDILSSTWNAKEALLAMIQGSPPQYTTTSKTEVSAPITSKDQSPTRSNPTSEWIFIDPITAPCPSQLVNRNTLEPVKFGEFLRGYLAIVRAEARQAKIDAGMTPKAIMDEATRQAIDFDRDGQLAIGPGFKEVLDAAMLSYEVKRKVAEDKWYQTLLDET